MGIENIPPQKATFKDWGKAEIPSQGNIEGGIRDWGARRGFFDESQIWGKGAGKNLGSHVGIEGKSYDTRDNLGGVGRSLLKRSRPRVVRASVGYVMRLQGKMKKDEEKDILK